MKSNISFILFAYNEEKRISYAIKNLIQYGEVIVLDGGSTDKTKEISENLGAKFFRRPENKKAYVETEENFNFIKNIIETDWIYWGYVDNLLPKKLLDKLETVSNQNKIKIVYAPLYTYLWGNTTNYIQKSGIPVIFHKNYVNFSNPRIHSMGDFTGKESEKLFLPRKEEYAVKHFSLYDMHKFVLGHLKYAETEAEEKYSSGKKFSLLLMIASMFRYMWIYGKCGYKNGKLGLIIVLHYAFFRLMAYTRLYELENKIDLEGSEKNYSIEKEKILNEFLK
jgi:glycosyltransferase involved in cell wall biosynthesis